jgi:prephenate dehydrogenase
MSAEIAIIGAGRFGRFVARELRKAGRTVVVADRRPVRVPGARTVSVREAARHAIVLLAVPAGSLPSVLQTIAPHLAPDAVVCDLCAVKEQPAAWMKKLLPRSVRLLGLHPLFGPDSARGGIAGLRIVLCPVRISPAAVGRLRRLLRARGLIVVTTTPREHDRAMATTLFVTQFAGRALDGLVSAGPVRTRNAELLAGVIAASVNDAPSVLRDLWRYNAFTRAVPAAIRRRFDALRASLG